MPVPERSYTSGEAVQDDGSVAFVCSTDVQEWPWLALAPQEGARHETVRAAAAEHGGHATLLRAPEALRAAVPVFQPQETAKAMLSRRVKDGFDPKHVLNPGRMYAGV